MSFHRSRDQSLVRSADGARFLPRISQDRPGKGALRGGMVLIREDCPESIPSFGQVAKANPRSSAGMTCKVMARELLHRDAFGRGYRKDRMTSVFQVVISAVTGSMVIPICRRRLSTSASYSAGPVARRAPAEPCALPWADREMNRRYRPRIARKATRASALSPSAPRATVGIVFVDRSVNRRLSVARIDCQSDLSAALDLTRYSAMSILQIASEICVIGRPTDATDVLIGDSID